MDLGERMSESGVSLDPGAGNQKVMDMGEFDGSEVLFGARMEPGTDWFGS
jgi:hypothetical protein